MGLALHRFTQHVEEIEMKTRMTFLLHAALAVGVLCSPLPASDDVLSQTPDPVIRLARVNEDGSLSVLVSRTREITEQRTNTIEFTETRQVFESNDEGLKLIDVSEIVSREIVYSIQIPIRETLEFRADAGQFQGYSMKGKQIADQELARRLKKATPVVISAERKSVIDPLYLSLFNTNSILLVIDAKISPDPEPAPPIPEVPAPPAPSADAHPEPALPEPVPVK
jgi:hypothetical protein